MIVRVRAPGSCGELVQGTIAGQNFLVTCPVALFSEVEIDTSISLAGCCGDKIKQAIQKTMTYLKIADTQWNLSVRSELPEGKGMASSSADISAACQAIAITAKRLLTPNEIADIALSIEPTDAVFYPGITMFDHVRGIQRKILGIPPEIVVAIFDVGGAIDTLQFNQRNDLLALNRDKERQVTKALELVARGLAMGDARLIGKGATMSAIANQGILYKPCLDTMIGIAEKHDAVGVNVAHSGTVIGILFADSSAERINECVAEVRETCSDVQYQSTVSLISGGLWQGSDNNGWKSCF